MLDDIDRIVPRTLREVLAPLLEQLPAGAHVVMCSRADPPVPLARLRLRAQLVEVREADLQFSPSEVEHFVDLQHKEGVDRDALVKLVDRIEGWPAGLGLAALAVAQRRQDDTASFLPTGPPPAIADYLIGEVLDRLEPDVRDFVLNTSVLDVLEPATCEALTGRRDAARLLRGMAA